MRAMVLTGPGELALDSVEQPAPSADQVLVHVTHSGICGTDYKIFNGSIPVHYPLIPGHEMAGEVVDPGGNAAFKSGDRVIIDPELYCGACFHCR
ncbi:MAG: alcohol dehydrogenase catalytic domain-containing protein, partial [Vicinamibacterales bacterium]